MSSSYFVEAIGSYLMRGTNPIYVKDYAMARALFALQDEDYNFTPMKKKIHFSDSICESCGS